MSSKKDKCVVIIPTIHNISQSKSVECYIQQMLIEDFVMPICVVDNSESHIYEANRFYLEEIKGRFEGKVTLYHFGKQEQTIFFCELAKKGIDRESIEILKNSSGYGASRNKCFLIAKSLGAESIFFFDDDTRPNGAIFKAHFEILGREKDSQKISIVSGPYTGVRGINFTFIENRTDQIKFLEALGHHGESSLHYLTSREATRENSPVESSEHHFETVKNIRGGNFLIGAIYGDIVCPTTKQAPGIDDTFVARRVIEKGHQVVKSRKSVIHEHFQFKSNKHSILAYLESWARTISFESLYNGMNFDTTINNILRYGNVLLTIENQYCTSIGKKIQAKEYTTSLINDISFSINDYQKLKNTWKHIIALCSSVKLFPMKKYEKISINH
ncbi:MAG: hypothetical protein FJ264_01250 [Planctomycetes bacterium]|nr:hypothetical protein [Planctomycetota bacterium]